MKQGRSYWERRLSDGRRARHGMPGCGRRGAAWRSGACPAQPITVRRGTPWERSGGPGLMRVGLVERPTAQAGREEPAEVGALAYVLVRAGEGMLDGLAGSLGLDDLLVELPDGQWWVGQLDFKRT